MQSKETVNMKITNVSLSMADHGVLSLDLTLEGGGRGVVFGGRVLGKGYLGATDFTGSAEGIEYIMRIMDTVGVDRLEELKGKYVRMVDPGWGGIVDEIGNITEDKWFNAKEFFEKEKKDCKKVNVGDKVTLTGTVEEVKDIQLPFWTNTREEATIEVKNENGIESVTVWADLLKKENKEDEQ
jgi:hypothetical protein